MPESILHPQNLLFKTCSRCKTEKLVSEFRAEKRTKIGLQSRCKACEAAYAKTPQVLENGRASSRKRLENPERAAYMREYAKQDHIKQKNNARTVIWQKENAARVKANNDAWRAANPDKKREINADWNARNKPAKVASIAKYRATKANATPAWADLEAIKRFYIMAVELGMQVDHVIPLHGNNVSGLHVQNNLQLLSKSENCSKGNRWSDS
jgi:hypothetical protein